MPAMAGRGPLRVWILLAFLAALSGCGSDKKPPPPCPRVAVLDQAANLTRYAEGSGRDFVDVDYQIEVTDILSGCRFEADDENSVMVVALAPVLVATRGPANTDRTASVRYFVSVVGPDRSILNKQEFQVGFAFESNQRRVLHREDDPPITVDLPVRDAARASAYEILVGLQLSREQLDDNLRRFGGDR